MTDIFFGLAMSFIFLASAWGWGQILAAVYRVPLLRLGAFASAAGLALLAFIGGVLNLAGIAKSETLVSIVLLGAVFSIVVLVRKRPWQRFRQSLGSSAPARIFLLAVPTALACTAGIFASACLMPTSIFNFHDDFHTYIPRVVRILESGSIAGNPFDGMGLDSLGSQSFLQGFFVAMGGPRMANGFDAVCCLFLVLLLITQCARAWHLPVSLQILTVMAAAIITPQYVNISPLYSSALATLSLVVWGSALAKQLSVSGETIRGMECVGALLIALLISLKVTVATFAAIYLAALYTVLFAASSRKLVVAKSALMTALLSGIFVLPWILAHWPAIQHSREIAAALRTEGLLPATTPSMAAHDIPKLFSFRSLYYGDSLPAFHFLVLTCVATALLALVFWWKLKTRPAGFVSVTCAGFAVLGVYLINAHMFAFENAVRYSVPVLIACSVTLPMLLCRLSARRGRANTMTMGIGTVMVVTVAIFAKTFSTRMALAVREHRAFVFPVNADYLKYCRESFSRAETARAIEIQQKIPSGTKTLVWAATPFHLDFSRNELMTVTDPGLINPALHFPSDLKPEMFALFLQQWGIQYVLIDVRGFGIKDVGNLMWQAESEDSISRKLAERGIYLRRVLAAIGAQSEIVHADKRTVVFKLPSVKEISK